MPFIALLFHKRFKLKALKLTLYIVSGIKTVMALNVMSLIWLVYVFILTFTFLIMSEECTY